MLLGAAGAGPLTKLLNLIYLRKLIINKTIYVKT